MQHHFNGKRQLSQRQTSNIPDVSLLHCFLMPLCLYVFMRMCSSSLSLSYDNPAFTSSGMDVIFFNITIHTSQSKYHVQITVLFSAVVPPWGERSGQYLHPQPQQQDGEAHQVFDSAGRWGLHLLQRQLQGDRGQLRDWVSAGVRQPTALCSNVGR